MKYWWRLWYQTKQRLGVEQPMYHVHCGRHWIPRWHKVTHDGPAEWTVYGCAKVAGGVPTDLTIWSMTP